MAWTPLTWLAEASPPEASPSAHQRRRVSARKRRALAKWLRRTACVAPDRDRTRRRFQVLLPERAQAVRSELLELADLIEQADDPDPACFAELRRLLTDGCWSPLYNPDIHVSELQATVHYLRLGLTS